MALKVLGTFNIPQGLSQKDLDKIKSLIGSNGSYDTETRFLIFKNEKNEELYSIDLSSIIAKDYDTTEGSINSKFTSIEELIDNLEKEINGLSGSVIYIGKIDNPSPTQEDLNSAATTFLKGETLIQGHAIKDSSNNSWVYNGTEWVDMGDLNLVMASNTEFGVVKGGTDISITAGEMTVLHAQDSDTLGGKNANSYLETAQLKTEVFEEDTNGEIGLKGQDNALNNQVFGKKEDGSYGFMNQSKIPTTEVLQNQTLSVSSWSTSVGESGYYEYTLSNSKIKANIKPEVIPHVEKNNLDTISESGVLSTVLAQEGSIVFYSKEIPKSDIIVDIYLEEIG